MGKVYVPVVALRRYMHARVAMGRGRRLRVNLSEYMYRIGHLTCRCLKYYECRRASHCIEAGDRDGEMELEPRNHGGWSFRC